MREQPPKLNPRSNRTIINESILGKVTYLITLGFLCALIAMNHSSNTPKYIEILQGLILIGVPSPLGGR